MDEIATKPPELVITNFHRRFTGVSATANAVVSRQCKQFQLSLVGNSLPGGPVPISFRQAVAACRKPPADRPFVIWHVRRNLEMAAAIFARDVLRLPIRIVFTSAAQRLHSAFPRHLISKMDAVIATTPKAASFVPNLAAVVPHGVDTEKFTPSDDRVAAWAKLGYGGQFGIGIVGRLRREKGTDQFVDAMIRTLHHRPGFSAVIIGRAMPGDAGFEQELRRRIQNAQLADRIIFAGEVPPERMPELYRSLSLLVAPAIYEGYGMTPLEAMASGVAVVASRTGAYEEMVAPGITGSLVGISQIDELSNAILTITADPPRLLGLGTAARRRAVDFFSLDGETRGIQQVYNDLWQSGTTQLEASPSKRFAA